MFGQEFPNADAPLSQQGMSVITAMVGLAAFAMVLALVEQVVQDAFEANVKHGTKVYEEKHVSCWHVEAAPAAAACERGPGTSEYIVLDSGKAQSRRVC